MSIPRSSETRAANGHYLFEAAAIIHRVIGSDRSLNAERADALICVTGGALQLFLADVEAGLIKDLGIAEQGQRTGLACVLSDEFLELEREALLGIPLPRPFVGYILDIANDLKSQLDNGVYSHKEVVGRARQFLMTTCGVGKMPLMGYYAKTVNVVDHSTYKTKSQQTEWGLIGLGLITLAAGGGSAALELNDHMAAISKVLGSTFLGKALF